MLKKGAVIDQSFSFVVSQKWNQLSAKIKSMYDFNLIKLRVQAHHCYFSVHDFITLYSILEYLN